MQHKSQLLRYAKRMRSEPTDAEARLWHHLRAGRLSGHKFKRQQPLGPYVVDFVCFSGRLVIEVDGSQHIDLHARDGMRSAWLQAQGFHVLRFWNDDVLKHIELVLDEVLRMLGGLQAR